MNHETTPVEHTSRLRRLISAGHQLLSAMGAGYEMGNEGEAGLRLPNRLTEAQAESLAKVKGPAPDTVPQDWA